MRRAASMFAVLRPIPLSSMQERTSVGVHTSAEGKTQANWVNRASYDCITRYRSRLPYKRVTVTRDSRHRIAAGALHSRARRAESGHVSKGRYR